MNLNTIPKFVVNLERRKDRLEKIQKELSYIGWEYEIFKAVDTNDHKGCSLSHASIIKLAKENNWGEVLVIEDDCTFMPYSKSLVDQINEECRDLDYFIFNLAPTLNRPVNVSDKYKLLVDLTNLPPANEYHRGIFATNMILYNKKSYDIVLEIERPENIGYFAIDDYIYKNVFLKHQSYSPVLPIGPQTKDWSDVSQGDYSNFYTQTYNWNNYCPYKIPSEFLSYENNQKIKEQNIHKIFNYVS